MSSPGPSDPVTSAPLLSDTESLLCPLCDYDLRAQVEPRCPECGYTFDWTELRDPARRKHRYLFEHHLERNLWSLRRTFFGGLRPRQFWAEIYPTQPSHLIRLLVYWLIVASVCMIPYLVVLGQRLAMIDASNRSSQSAWRATISSAQMSLIVWHYGSLQAYMDQVLPLWPSWGILREASGPFGRGALPLTGLITLAWPWLTFAALMVFQISMRRAKVRPVHVLRCVIYSADVALPIALLAAALATYPLWLMLSRSRTLPIYRREAWGFDLSVALLVLLTYRLWIAYRKYLRFDHALATVVVSQIMVALLVFKFALDWRLVG
jgi:hypothetical protein